MIPGSMLILLAMTGQPPVADRPANPPAVVSKPGAGVHKQWLVTTSPIDGRPIQVLGWYEGGQPHFDPRDYPQFAPATPPRPEPTPTPTTRAATAPAASAANPSNPTGVIVSKFPRIEAGHSWTGGNAPAFVVGDPADRPTSPEVYVTIIGPKRERERAKAELSRSPEFAGVLRELGPRIAFEAYDPRNPLVADVGLPAGGSPDVVVLDATGKEIERFASTPSPSALAEAVRKADPDYRPGGRPLLTRGTDLGPFWIAAAVAAIFFIAQSRKG